MPFFLSAEGLHRPSVDMSDGIPNMGPLGARRPEIQADALHRQITNLRGRGLLFRKKQQTGIEGSNAASASHGSANRTLQCNAGAYGTLHSTKLDDQRFRRSAAGAP